VAVRLGDHQQQTGVDDGGHAEVVVRLGVAGPVGIRGRSRRTGRHDRVELCGPGGGEGALHGHRIALPVQYAPRRCDDQRDHAGVEDGPAHLAYAVQVVRTAGDDADDPALHRPVPAQLGERGARFDRCRREARLRDRKAQTGRDLRAELRVESATTFSARSLTAVSRHLSSSKV
jgi:hypothetical protein